MSPSDGQTVTLQLQGRILITRSDGRETKTQQRPKDVDSKSESWNERAEDLQRGEEERVRYCEGLRVGTQRVTIKKTRCERFEEIFEKGGVEELRETHPGCRLQLKAPTWSLWRRWKPTDPEGNTGTEPPNPEPYGYGRNSVTETRNDNDPLTHLVVSGKWLWRRWCPHPHGPTPMAMTRLCCETNDISTISQLQWVMWLLGLDCCSDGGFGSKGVGSISVQRRLSSHRTPPNPPTRLRKSLSNGQRRRTLAPVRSLKVNVFGEHDRDHLPFSSSSSSQQLEAKANWCCCRHGWRSVANTLMRWPHWLWHWLGHWLWHWLWLTVTLTATQ